MDEELEIQGDGCLHRSLTASLLSFQLSNMMSIFVVVDDGLDSYGFIRATSSCYCSLMGDMVLCFPGSSISKESACSAGDPGSNPGLGRSLGKANGNAFQYSCLENPRDRGTWWAIVHGIARVRYDLTTKPLPPFFEDERMSGVY